MYVVYVMYICSTYLPAAIHMYRYVHTCICMHTHAPTYMYGARTCEDADGKHVEVPGLTLRSCLIRGEEPRDESQVDVA